MQRIERDHRADPARATTSAVASHNPVVATKEPNLIQNHGIELAKRT
jgi:hypothetical protein